MHKPKVSIIVPNYNHAAFLQQRLDSIFNQTFQDFEVILLDDCSTDNSVELLKSYATNKQVSNFIVNKTNSGSPFKQWKKGLDLAKGTFIWIAESDDFCKLTFLEKAIAKMELKDTIGLVYARSNKVDEFNNFTENFWADNMSPTRWKKDFTAKGTDEIRNFLKFRNTIPNASACIFKKECIINGNIILDFKYTGDWVFWIQILSNTDVFYISETLNHFRYHKNSTRSIKDKQQEINRFIEYAKSINIANVLLSLNDDYYNSAYNWIYHQLKTNKITMIDILFNFANLKVFLIPYFKYLYLKS